MQTATDVFVEFRCNVCYQIRHEPAEDAGSEVECPYCHSANLVPEVTPDRIRTAADVESAAEQSSLQAGIYADSSMSGDEIDRVAKDLAVKQVAEPGSNWNVDVGHLSCGRGSRSIAYLIDCVVGFLFIATSVIVGQALSQRGLCQPIVTLAGDSAELQVVDWICYGAIATMGYCFIWFLVAVYGQSPGKFIMNIKIVNAMGNPPGLVQGVVLRSWVANFLFSIVPFGGLANLIVFFWGTPPRALHDYMSGTWVIHKS